MVRARAKVYFDIILLFSQEEISSNLVANTNDVIYLKEIKLYPAFNTNLLVNSFAICF